MITTRAVCRENIDQNKERMIRKTIQIDKVYNADCLRLMTKISDKSAKLILTDPPYGIRYKSHNKSLARRTVAGDEYPYIWWLQEAARILTDDGCLLCFTRWDVLPSWLTAIEYTGLIVRSCIVWDKGVHGMGNTKAAFAPRYEMCLFATKPAFHFPGGRPVDVIRVPKVPGAKMVHPTQKPVALMQQLIESTTVAGDLVIDPFCGSGATAIAALKTGRHYIAIDIELSHCRSSRRRIEQCKADPQSVI